MQFVWIAFKFLLSAVLVIAAIVVAFGAVVADRWLEARALALVALFFLLAALPWVFPLKKHPRAAALLCIFLAPLFAVLAYQALFGGFELPKDCSTYRARLGCYIVNAVYGVSGRAGVAALWAGVAGFLLFGARKFMKRSGRGYA